MAVGSITAVLLLVSGLSLSTTTTNMNANALPPEGKGRVCDANSKDYDFSLCKSYGGEPYYGPIGVENGTRYCDPEYKICIGPSVSIRKKVIQNCPPGTRPNGYGSCICPAEEEKAQGKCIPKCKNDEKGYRYCVVSVKVWINAFIPRDIPGLTLPVPGRPFSGKTMIPGPIPGTCFLTDDRSFSSKVHTSSRMHSEMEIYVPGELPTQIYQGHAISETHQIACKDGNYENSGTASNSRMRFTNLGIISLDVYEVYIKGEANNPLVTPSPDIDYDGKFIIDTKERRVSFQGLIDGFPAFEAYASINLGPAQKIFQVNPKPGSNVWDLIGKPSIYVNETTVFR